MVAKTSQKATPGIDKRLQILQDAIVKLGQIEDSTHADEIFIRDAAYVLALAETVLTELALQRANKSSYLAQVHKQAWSRKNHG